MRKGKQQDTSTMQWEMYEVFKHILKNKPEEKEIVEVRCPDCKEMVSNFQTHSCTGKAG